MLIVVDTNALAAVAKRELVPLLELLEYGDYTDAIVAIPEVAQTEFVAYLDRAFSEAEQEISKSIRRLPESVVKSISFDRFRRAGKAGKRRLTAKLAAILRQGRMLKLPISKSQARRAVKRATERRPPCSQSGEEVRDAMIWEAAIDQLKRRKGPLVLLSADKQFRSTILEQEVKALRTTLAVFDSIDGFLSGMHVRHDHIPKSTIEVISANDKFLESLMIHVAADPYGGWDAMVSNFIEGGVLDLIAGDYQVESIEQVSMLDGLRRPLGNGRYSVCLPFEAVVQVKCEAFKWEMRAPQPRLDPPAAIEDDGNTDFAAVFAATVPSQVPVGAPDVIELDCDIRGDAIFLASESALDLQPVTVRAGPISTGFRGQPRISTLVLGVLPGQDTRHIAETLQRRRPPK